MEDKKISILYSGGSDSTYSAALLAEEFSEIHLVTFKHYSTWNVGRSVSNVERLKSKFKDVCFKHVFLNSSELFLKLQKNIFSKFKKFPYFTLYVCGACKLAMHTQLIAYNLEHGISSASSGASRKMTMFPAQTDGGLKTLYDFYSDYGIFLINPVYKLNDIDEKAVRMGVFEKRHLKRNHKSRNVSQFYIPVKNILDNIQGFCFWIGVIDLYNYFLRRKMTSLDVSNISADYYRYAIDSVCRKYIDARKNSSLKNVNPGTGR